MSQSSRRTVRPRPRREDGSRSRVRSLSLRLMLAEWVTYSRLRLLRLCLLARRMNRHYNRKAGPQPALQRVPGIEGNLYRNSLHNLGEIARRIVRREQRELRSACRSNFDNFSMEHDTGKRIDPDIGHVAGSDIGKLSLLEVRLNPDVTFDQIDDLHPGRNQLALLDVPFTNRPSRGRHDPGVTKIYLGYDNRGLFPLNICFV